MSIRPCRLQDFRAVHQLVSDNFRHLISESSLRYWLSYERPWFYVARHQGRISAFIHVQPRHAEGTLWLNMLAVASERRGQGVAGEMLAFCEQLATDNGFRKVALQCLTDNTPALAFYEQAAFRRVGESSYKSMGMPFFMYEKSVPERPANARTTQGMRKDPMLLCKAHRLFYFAWIAWRSGLIELNKS